MKMYVTGGYVRDMIANRQSKDIDIVVVGATYQQMLDLGYHPVGKDFPVFLSNNPNNTIEYALARTERKIGEGYTAFECNTENVSLKDDLMRRDLTINALAIELPDIQHHVDESVIIDQLRNKTEEDVIDYFNGIADIEWKWLKHLSDAFDEDPVRVLRLARFHALGYGDVSTLLKEKVQNMVKRGDLTHLTQERILLELTKTIKSIHNVSQLDKFTSLLSLFGLDGIIFNTKFITILDKSNSFYENSVIMSLWHNQQDVVKIALTCYLIGISSETLNNLTGTKQQVSFLQFLERIDFKQVLQTWNTENPQVIYELSVKLNNNYCLQMITTFVDNASGRSILCTLYKYVQKIEECIKIINKVNVTYLDTYPLLQQYVLDGVGVERKQRLTEIQKLLIDELVKHTS